MRHELVNKTLLSDNLQNICNLEFPWSIGHPGGFTDAAKGVLASFKADRNELCDALSVYNQQLDRNENTQAQSELLRQDNTLCIVTGQQSGLFSGPLYTIHKIITTIKIKRSLPWARVSISSGEEVPRIWLMFLCGLV